MILPCTCIDVVVALGLWDPEDATLNHRPLEQAFWAFRWLATFEKPADYNTSGQVFREPNAFHASRQLSSASKAWSMAWAQLHASTH